MAAIKVTKVVYEEIDSENFERARRASGLSQLALCRKAAVHDQFVSRLERGLVGEVPAERLGALADAMVGEGDFKDQDRDAVLAVIRGKASFHLQLVGDDQPDPIASTAENSVIPGYLKVAA